MGYGQFAATTQFYLYGKRNCTSTGWERARKAYSQPDVLEQASLNLAGRVFMVTGANAGIGREITRFLASKGAMVYMVCRNLQKAGAARDVIAAEAKCATSALPLLQCDCSLEADVRRAWSEFSSRQKEMLPAAAAAAAATAPPRLDGLVCNAGALLNERTLTSEGVEVTFAAHLLFGTYLLGSLAMPALEATPDSRLVVVSSGGMYNTKFPSWDVATSTAEQPAYDGQFAYAYAKRGQVLLCERWALAHPKVKVVSCHPGWTLTEGVEAAYGEKKSYLEPLRTLWQGAEGICWLCVADSTLMESGAFYLDRTPQTKHLAGPFFSEGTFTKNTPQEVDEMMRQLDVWTQPGGRPSQEQLKAAAARSARLQRPLQASSTPLDLQSFMGRWYVLANIPTALEVGTRNCIENYAWDEQRKGVDILFEYVGKSAADDHPSSIAMRAAVANAPVNTHWTLRPKILGVHWPLNLAYLVVDVDPDGEYCVIGEPKRKNLWVMTRRKPSKGAGGRQALVEVLQQGAEAAGAGEAGGAGGAEMDAAAEASVLRRALAKAQEEGYDTEQVVRVQWTT